MNDLSDVLGDVIDAGTSILLGAQPVIGKPGLSTIEDRRIKRLADAVAALRLKLGYNESKDGQS